MVGVQCLHSTAIDAYLHLVWKSLKYTGAVRYFFLLQLVNVICQTLSKFEEKKFYLTALICNCLKMQKYSCFSHSVLSQLSVNYVDLYNVHLLNRLVEGSALFFLKCYKEMNWLILLLFFSRWIPLLYIIICNNFFKFSYV